MTSIRKSKGFTLLEVLVALGIVALALLAALRASGQLAEHTDQLALRSMAMWSADSRLAQLHLVGDPPALGERSFACPQANHEFECEERVSATPNPFFLRVEVSVFDSSQRGVELAMLATVMPMKRGN